MATPPTTPIGSVDKTRGFIRRTRWPFICGAALGAALVGSIWYFYSRDSTPVRKREQVRNDYVAEVYKGGDFSHEKQFAYVAETREGGRQTFYGDKEDVNSRARKIKRGDIISYLSGDLRSIIIEEPNPYGEVPFDMPLDVASYTVTDFRDFTDPARINGTVATIKARSRIRDGSETYTLMITGSTERDLMGVMEHLRNYTRLVIPESSADSVETHPTANGMELVVPAYKVRWLDSYELGEVAEGNSMRRAPGSVTPDGVFRPWEPEKKQAGKPGAKKQ